MVIAHLKRTFFDIVREGVKVDCFFKPFKGNFKGRSYDAPRPPSIRLSRFVKDFEILFPRLCLIGWLLEYLMCEVGSVR